MTIRNRIKGHRRVRAGDLVPHEWNFRVHPDHQKAALEALYQEVGFARSLLGYELPDGRLKLIDGHLRRDLDPDMEVDVEILDVNDDEAQALLLSIDPLTALAETQEQIRDRLLALRPTPSEELEAAWRAAAEASLATAAAPVSSPLQRIPAQFLILITCRDERHQVDLLKRFAAEGLDFKSPHVLISRCGSSNVGKSQKANSNVPEPHQSPIPEPHPSPPSPGSTQVMIELRTREPGHRMDAETPFRRQEQARIAFRRAGTKVGY